MNGRYLTPDDKVRELAYWEQAKAERPTDFPARFRSPESDWRIAAHELGGLGFPDPEMYAVCDELNRITEVCTLQSCAGHRNADESAYSGQLWIWLSEPLARTFEYRAPRLYRHAGIEQVRKLWLPPEGREVVDIIFAGQHSPKFAAATAAIVHFFRALRRPMPTGLKQAGAHA